jgi:molybdopterin molybdotransferase
VAVIPTGDEIVPPGAPVCRPGQVRDVVSVALAALITRDGGLPRVSGVVPDRREALEAAVSEVLPESELVLVLGGSSVGARDHTAAVIDGLGPPGVLFHGLALKPGKPTLFGLCGAAGGGERAVAVFGLPGHPVSALVVYRLLVRTALRLVAGEAVPAWRDEAGADPLEATVAATLIRAVPSDQGREDYVCVRLRPRPSEAEAASPPAPAGSGPPGSGRGAVLLAEPVFGKSGLITMLAQADGLVRIPAGRRGLEPGTEVEVILLD